MQQEQPTQDTEAAGQADTLDLIAESVADPVEWLPEQLQPLWMVLVDYPLLSSFALAVLSYLVARTVVYLFRRGTSQLSRRTSTDIDDQIFNILTRPLFAVVFYAGLALSVLVAGLSPGMTQFLLRVLISLALLITMNAAFPISSIVLESLARLRDRYEFIQDRTVPLFNMVSKILVVGVFAYALLMVWNIDPTAWLASAGVVGIAVGFAAKDTLANLFSGVLIVVDTPYKIGDFVNLDSGERGMVTHVGLRSTRLLTRDDIEITIPNAVMGNAKIVNESGGRWSKRRLRIKVGVAYGSDVDRVCEVLQSVVEGHPKICRQPEPRVRMRALGDSSLDFEMLGWIDEPVDRGKVSHELLMSVYKALNEAEIEIPFPQRDIHIRSQPGSADT